MRLGKRRSVRMDPPHTLDDGMFLPRPFRAHEDPVVADVFALDDPIDGLLFFTDDVGMRVVMGVGGVGFLHLVFEERTWVVRVFLVV